MNFNTLLLLGVGYFAFKKLSGPAAKTPSKNGEITQANLNPLRSEPGALPPTVVTAISDGNDAQENYRDEAYAYAKNVQPTGVADQATIRSGRFYVGSDNLPTMTKPDVSVVGDQEYANHVMRRTNGDMQAYKRGQRQAMRDDQLAMDSDSMYARADALRSRVHGENLKRSLQQSNDPTMVMAYAQGHKPYNSDTGNGFIKNPAEGFVDAEPVNVNSTDYSNYEIVNAPGFENTKSAKDLGLRDYPKFVDQKEAVSDFSGILVHEAGSADFSSKIVNDVKSDFGRR
jgi:hypothetical protein